MKNRLELPKLFAQKGFKRGVEVGTAQGRFAQIMLDTIPDLELTCVDSYEGKWAVNYEIAKEALGDRFQTYFDLAYDFIQTEYLRFRKAKDSKMAQRYYWLYQYFLGYKNRNA